MIIHISLFLVTTILRKIASPKQETDCNLSHKSVQGSVSGHGFSREAAEKVALECFVTGHDFSRADKPLIFIIPSGLQAARDPPFRLFQPCLTRMR